MTNFTALDTETTLIGINNVIPDLVCTTGYDLHTEESNILHWSPVASHTKYIRQRLSDPDEHLIFHNASFDLGVFAKQEWGLTETIWGALEAGRIHDTMLREMLLNLTLSGSIDIIEQYGIKQQVTYSLASLVKQYFQIDLSEEKDAEDSVRLNYEMVRYKPLEEWPKEFIEYAKDDPMYTGLIFLEQEKRREDCIQTTGHDPFTKEPHLVKTAFSLYLMTSQGNKLDTERVLQITKEFRDLYDDPELVWPLVHSSFVQDNSEGVRPSKVIEHAKGLFGTIREKDQRSVVGKGMVIPAQLGKPFANGAKEHLETCAKHKDHPEYTAKKLECDCPPKMTTPKPEKGSDINLHQYVWSAARRNPNIKVWLSDGFRDKLKEAGIDIPHPVPQDFIEEHVTVPSVALEEGCKPTRFTLKVNKEWLATFAALDPVLEKYDERHKIQKIITSYLPCFYWAEGYKTACPLILEGQTDKFAGKQPAERVHAQFAVLKETGRTSSYAAKRGKGNSATVTFPSFNGQQVDPRIRQCVVAEEGNVLFSADFSAMELGTAAQVAYNLLGHKGVLMELINAGKDTHAYLGAQIATALDPDFTKAWGLSAEDPMASYDLFKSVAKNKEVCDSTVFRDIFEECYLGKKWGDHVVTWEDCIMSQYYKHFRTFGKPTGLGFWGGLGEPTFVSMAKASYGIQVDIEIAKVLRQIWRTYIPEGQEYLNYVDKHMVDRLAEPELVEDADGRRKKNSFYCYTTPMGMHRAKCSYTAAANGCALQSPSAEGATAAVVDIMKECTVGGLAGRVFPSLFIHDEVFGEAVYDDQITSRMTHLADIMVSNMEKVTPDVRASVEVSLMYRWNKRAEPVWEKGKLLPWVQDGYK